MRRSGRTIAISGSPLDRAHEEFNRAAAELTARDGALPSRLPAEPQCSLHLVFVCRAYTG
jgi:hypothetical protein